MADLLGSILGTMQKPPTLGGKEVQKAKEQKKQMEKLQKQEREKMSKFKAEIQKKINELIKDGSQQKLQFEPMDTVYRAVIHEVSEVAGMASFSFGEEDVNRYVIVWKREFVPTEEELAAHRRGEDWDPERAKQLVTARKEMEAADSDRLADPAPDVVPHTNYKEKYERLIGRASAKEGAKATSTNTAYGLVPSENKRDLRTIEQVMADSKAKRLKTDHHTDQSHDLPAQSHDTHQQSHDHNGQSTSAENV